MFSINTGWFLKISPEFATSFVGSFDNRRLLDVTISAQLLTSTIYSRAAARLSLLELQRQEESMLLAIEQYNSTIEDFLGTLVQSEIDIETYKTVKCNLNTRCKKEWCYRYHDKSDLRRRLDIPYCSKPCPTADCQTVNRCGFSKNYFEMVMNPDRFLKSLCKERTSTGVCAAKKQPCGNAHSGRLSYSTYD